ncbi:MAG: NDP-sugar synthase [Solirubrobacteraceae bacterium]|nr:NDP-sugar synthase [Solirubrobacteraceae bacterium]
MKAMVLAAGLGTRLRPLTYELPKPMVPVVDRPVMAHIVDLLKSQGITDVIANLHYFPDTIRDYFGDEITYRYEPELLGTAGGVRNCRDFFGDEPFLVISGDALTDLDVGALRATHDRLGGVATLTVKQVPDTREFGVVITDENDRILGFQEKPAPEEAKSDLGNCGIYLFSPEIFDYYPEADPVDWAFDIFPTLLANDIPFHIHRANDEYWNDVGSLAELKAGTFDALTGELALPAIEGAGPEAVIVGEGSSIDAAEDVKGPVFIGSDVTIGEGVRLTGPVVIGDRAVIGEGAMIRDSIVLPGTVVEPGSIVIGATLGRAGIIAAMTPRHSPTPAS